MLLSAFSFQPIDAAKACQGLIETRDFYHPGHAHIFDCLMECVEQGLKPDPVVLIEALKEKRLLDACGGAGYVIEAVFDISGFAANIPRYAAIINAHRVRRDAIALAGELAEKAYDEVDVSDLALAALEGAQALVDTTNRRVRLRTMDEMLGDYLNTLDARAEGQGLGIRTGFRDLDHMTQGMREGELWVCGARPKVGKSGFAANLALNVIQAGHRVLLVSVEMAETEIMERLMAAEAKVPLRNLREGNLTDQLWERIHGATDRLSGKPLTILDDPNATVADVRSCGLRTGAELIIVDYAQLMKTEQQRSGTREREIADLTGSFKRLARELRCPVLLLSQVKRDADDRRPELGDMAESSSFEKNANVVLGLYREELVTGGAAGVMEVIVIASRATETGTARVAYNGALQRIVDFAQPDERARYN